MGRAVRMQRMTRMKEVMRVIGSPKLNSVSVRGRAGLADNGKDQVSFRSLKAKKTTWTTFYKSLRRHRPRSLENRGSRNQKNHQVNENRERGNRKCRRWRLRSRWKQRCYGQGGKGRFGG